MARPRRQVYTMQQYLDNEKEGYISNSISTQRNPRWKSIIDGLVVTILTDDYIPPLILAEDGSGRTVIVDGGSRTAAFVMLERGNYKIKSSVEDPIINYKAMEKDENGKITWKDSEFDIRNKTFDQFPKELKKKFYEYQVETVVHECTLEQATKYLRRYNEHSSMNANEKILIQLPNFAKEIRKIIDKPFFTDCINSDSISENQKEKGLLERIVSESVMCMFHLEKWNKNGKKMAKYLNSNAVKEEFDTFGYNIDRLHKVITDEAKVVFNSKDTFIWMVLFERFKKLNVNDSEFNNFIKAFEEGLKNKVVDGKLFDEVDKSGSTKDKKIIEAKLHILETLMNEYLHINEEDLKNVDTLDFVKETVGASTTEEDVEFYSDILDDLILNVDNNTKLLDPHNRPSLIALVGYACQNECDEGLENWIKQWFEKNTMYTLNQKRNFNIMLNDFQKGMVA